MSKIVSMTRRYSALVENDRDERSIVKHLKSEVVELVAEVDNGSAGEDGIVGEAIDIMLCALDLVFKHKPGITDSEIDAIAQAKNLKWAVKYGKLDRPTPEEPIHVGQCQGFDLSVLLRTPGYEIDHVAAGLQAGSRNTELSPGATFLRIDEGVYALWDAGRVALLNGLYPARWWSVPPGFHPAASLLVDYDIIFKHGVAVITRERPRT